MAPSTPSPPALEEAARKSTVIWQEDLQALFDHAKDRFADVVWELQANAGKGTDEVWGHKAVVYARAPPSFQARYFNFKSPPTASPHPYSSSPTGTLPAQSSLSLTLGVDFSDPSRTPSPSPFRAVSPVPSVNPGGPLRLATTINPTLFSNELEYLYTGKGLGQAFEFLFDASESREEGDAEDARIDKLRKDLVFMWRSRLYSDVRIALTGNFSSTNHDPATAIFSSHRFILASRSPYFSTQLLSWGVKTTPGEPLTLTLPSPPFTPASLHFSLGYIYTGTLVFSHRTFDLDTAFHIIRSAMYLQLDPLYDEVQARIVQEMMHGLFHAFVEFAEYERITGGKWGTGGCRCKQCARRAPRVLEFAILDDVKNAHLERGARRALVGLFGEGWCTSEFAGLPQRTRDVVIRGLAKRTTPMNVHALLYASTAALNKLETVIDVWGDTVRDAVRVARKTIDDVMVTQANECFEQEEWLDIMAGDGVKFEDGEKVEQILDSYRRGLNEKNAAMAYQILVDKVLVRPHPSDEDKPMLSSTSHVRVQVEECRMDVIRWLRRKWMTMKEEGAFNDLEHWALKEISNGMSIQLGFDDEAELLSSGSPATTVVGSKGLRASTLRGDDNDTVSMHSLRTGVLKGSPKDPAKSSAASVRSLARSTHSVSSRMTTSSVPRKLPLSPNRLRPDSKLTPAQSSSSSVNSLTDHAIPRSPKSPTPRISLTTTTNSVRKGTPSIASTTNGMPPRPKSVAASVKSTRSTTSTIRKGAAGPSTLRPPSSLSRPASTTSMNTDGSTAFVTAKTDLSSPVRTRRGSTTSTTSNLSVRTTGTTPTRTGVKPRAPSLASSRVSTASTKSKNVPALPTAAGRLSPVAKRAVSTTSIRSTTSKTSTTSRRNGAKTPVGSPAKPAPKLEVPDQDVVMAPPTAPSPTPSLRAKTERATANGTIKARTSRPKILHDKQASVVSSASTSTVRDSLKRKGSADTIREALPRGDTLGIGIPCIISSKKARFRAYARYIGEVEGELGPWVGVEVPMNDTWPGEKLDGRAWHDGTWGGIRYFDIGAAGDWGDDFGADLGTRRRRGDWLGNYGRDGKGTLKREGDQLSIERANAKRLRSVSPAVSDVSGNESRGLFVRPQQVLYVLDAVGSDL